MYQNLYHAKLSSLILISLNYKNLELNAIEAAQQCERLDIPKIEKILNFKLLLEDIP